MVFIDIIRVFHIFILEIADYYPVNYSQRDDGRNGPGQNTLAFLEKVPKEKTNDNGQYHCCSDFYPHLVKVVVQFFHSDVSLLRSNQSSLSIWIFTDSLESNSAAIIL